MLSTAFRSIPVCRRVASTLSWILDIHNASGLREEFDAATIQPDQDFDIFISRIEFAVWLRLLVEQFGPIEERKMFDRTFDPWRQKKSSAAGENYGNLPMIRRKTE